MTVQSQPHTFEVKLDAESVGTLLVTDLDLMVRPASAGQYHAQSPHDSGRIAAIMNLGDDDSNGWDPTWHIATRLDAQRAAEHMDRAWYAYFDGYCLGKSWIDATVSYIGAGGQVLFTRGYGLDDANIVGNVQVYCQEFWRAINP
ncbi:MAG TPA: hypothetical protein VGN15_06130, partial [Ktedonobacteraceae bacterium]|nr:hypothetical protein [Ktedonobacteraceae bacterium]